MLLPLPRAKVHCARTEPVSVKRCNLTSTTLLAKLHSREATITVVGLGYIGLPLALGLASKGFTVHGLDASQAKVGLLQGGEDYINGHDDVLRQVLENGTFAPTVDQAVLGASDAIIICLPTPLNRNREPDITLVTSVTERIAELIRPGTLVILESTTYPGTTEEIVMPALLAGGRVRQAGEDFFLAFSPERVDPGNPSFHTHNTTKVVGGITPACTEAAAALYRALLDSPDLVHVASSTRAAEMEKLFENIFRSVNIALVNEMALLCREMKLDVWEILELAGTKPFGFMRFTPGPGIGGHCIPLDPFYLSWKAREFDFPTRFIELAGEINSKMPAHVVDLTAEALSSKGLHGARVLLVGMAYKPNVPDHRESPSLKVLELLLKKGARVDYHDPLVPELQMEGETRASVSLDTLASYDAVVLLTPHSSLDLGRLVRDSASLVDTRGVTRKLAGAHSGRVLYLGAPTPQSEALT